MTSSILAVRSSQEVAKYSLANTNQAFEFPAKQAFDCLTSVPFNADVASRFIEYYNESIQFQSTLAYLKHPPSSYQQPAVDLIAGLDQIQSEIKDGKFPNQYAFEVSLQNLIYSAHDAHLNLFAGILSVFTFAAPYSIVSVSLDGAQLPQVYIAGETPHVPQKLQS